MNLGVKYLRTPKGMYLHKISYALQILAPFCTEEANPSYVPMDKGLKLRKEIGTPLCNPLLY